jgi:predicted transcriptional regulator
MVRDVLMSIRPPYSAAIFSGRKTVELRRRRPSFGAGTRILVYSTTPEQRLEGAFEVGGVLAEDPDTLWALVGNRAGVDRATFDDYFSGCEVAYAIEVTNVRSIAPVPLPIRPPQSYQFLDEEEPGHSAILALAAT